MRSPSGLREIPCADAPPPALPRPVPALPLPPGLRGRLLALPQRAPAPRPPAWVLSPRYAIAASYAAAVLLCAALAAPDDSGGPGALGRRLASGVGQTLERAESAGRERLEALENLEATALDRYRAARRNVAATVDRSVDRLEERLPDLPTLPEFPAKLAPFAPKAFDNHDNEEPRPGRGPEEETQRRPR